MANCITNAIQVDSLCGKVQGGAEYVVGFNWDSFKNQYDSQHGSPLEHLQAIVLRAGNEYYNDLLSGLALKGYNPIATNPNHSATANLIGGTTTKQVATGIFADAQTFLKKGTLHELKVPIAALGTWQIQLIVTNNGITNTYLLTATNYSTGIVSFALGNSPIIFDTLQATFLQPTPVYGVAKNTSYCKSCTGAKLCPKLKDVTTLGQNDFNGGNSIILSISCGCDSECHLYKKIGNDATVKATHALYIERALKKESIYGQNLSIANMSELNAIRIKELEKEIESSINKQLARIMPALKNEGQVCFTCGYNTFTKVANI